MKFEICTQDKYKSGIYKILCICTGKFYVGSTENFRRRYTAHKTRLKKGNHDNDYLQYSIIKYGIENFSFSIIEIVDDRTKLLEREQFYLDLYKSYENANGFNLSSIAGKVEFNGRTKKKMSDAYYANEEHRFSLLKKNHEAMRGVKQTEERRQESEMAGYKAAFKHRKITDKDVLNFIHQFVAGKTTTTKFAKEKDVSTSTIANIFKKLKSKGDDYLAIFKPILFKIGYVDANGESVTDLKNPEFLAKLDLNIEFQDGSDNLINDPVELYNFIQQD
jgi:group I intron endonuclease